MGFSTLVVALCIGAPPDASLVQRLHAGQTKPLELVALPLSTDNVNAPTGLKAWKTVTRELGRSRRKLKISTKLQKEQHDFLVGPAREQAGDCRMNVECLIEIGSTLGADLLVAGTVAPDGVTLVAIDIHAQKKVATAQSGKKLVKQKADRKARAATRNLIAMLAKPKKPKKPDPVAKLDTKKDGAKKADTKKDDLKDDTKKDDLKGDTKKDVPEHTTASTGTILIDKNQLSQVSQVTIDGTPVSFLGDGTIAWKGAPGSHTLAAVRTDGNKLTQSVLVEPNAVSRVTLTFKKLAPPPPKKEKEEEEEESITSKWWFWTSVGAAVAAGTATAVILAGGTKGGPSLPPETGAIRGTY